MFSSRFPLTHSGKQSEKHRLFFLLLFHVLSEGPKFLVSSNLLSVSESAPPAKAGRIRFRLPDWSTASCPCVQQQQKTGRSRLESTEYPTAHIERRPCVFLLDQHQLTNDKLATNPRSQLTSLSPSSRRPQPHPAPIHLTAEERTGPRCRCCKQPQEYSHAESALRTKRC